MNIRIHQIGGRKAGQTLGEVTTPSDGKRLVWKARIDGATGLLLAGTIPDEHGYRLVSGDFSLADAFNLFGVAGAAIHARQRRASDERAYVLGECAAQRKTEAERRPCGGPEVEVG